MCVWSQHPGPSKQISRLERRLIRPKVNAEALRNLDGGADAARADVVALRLTVDRHRLDLDVGAEAAVGARRLALPATRVLVPDVAPEGRALTADFTGCSHSPRTLAEAGDMGQGPEDSSGPGQSTRL